MFGEYPAEYNKKVHGPYDPARYYGKPDVPFAQVKLGEVGSWFGRRNIGPVPLANAITRAVWRYNHKYRFPKKAGMVHVFQILAMISMFSYTINYGKITAHRNVKYHW